MWRGWRIRSPSEEIGYLRFETEREPVTFQNGDRATADTLWIERRRTEFKGRHKPRTPAKR
jgi:hypothetical protein